MRQPARTWPFVVCLANLLLGAGTGCSRIGLDPAYAGPQAPPPELTARYRYTTAVSLAETAGNGIVPVSAASAGNDVVTVHAAISLPPNRFDVRTFHYYAPAGASARNRVPAVVMVPMLGRSDIAARMSRTFCEAIRSAGIAALYLDDSRSPVQEGFTPEEIETGLTAGTAEIRAALDWLSERPEIDRNRLGGVGISLGGIRLAIAAAVDPRLKANIIGLAGADIPDIIMNSGQDRVRGYRDWLIARYRTAGEVRRRLESAILSDPLKLAQHIDARGVLLVLASLDDCVPPRNGKLLYEKLGRPETVWLPTGHYAALAFSGYIQSLAVEFLKRRLGGGGVLI